MERDVDTLKKEKEWIASTRSRRESALTPPIPKTKAQTPLFPTFPPLPLLLSAPTLDGTRNGRSDEKQLESNIPMAYSPPESSREGSMTSKGRDDASTTTGSPRSPKQDTLGVFAPRPPEPTVTAEDFLLLAQNRATTSIHVTALDGLVNVNSLFTIAVFVGLSLTSPGQRSLANKSACDAGDDVAKMLLVFEVVSFSFFLFSSLVAQGLKLAINILNSKQADEAFRAHINSHVLRMGMIGSAISSMMGCIFLMLSMINVIQIRLGLLSCGSTASVRATAALITLVSTALVCYIATIFYAFTHWTLPG